MLRHLGEQVGRFGGGIVGATLGVIFSMTNPTSFVGGIAFLVVFFILYCLHNLPLYLVGTRNGVAFAWISFFIYTVLLVVAAAWFCHLGFLADDWNVKQVDFRALLVFITLFIVSLLTIIAATGEALFA
jgi:hypothetical protein